MSRSKLYLLPSTKIEVNHNEIVVEGIVDWTQTQDVVDAKKFSALESELENMVEKLKGLTSNTKQTK